MKRSALAVEDLPLVEPWGYMDLVGATMIAMPNDSFVVTRARDGSPLSTFGQPTWTILSGDRVIKIQKINFTSWSDGVGAHPDLEISLQDEMKRFFGYFLWFRPYGALSSASLANKSTMLRAVGRYALKARVSMADVCSNEKYFYAFLAQTSNSNIVEFAALITLLGYLRPKRTGVDLVAVKHIKKLDGMRVLATKKNKQDPPLPTRLYSNWITGLLAELHAFEQMLDEIIAAHLNQGAGGRGTEYLNNPEIVAYFESRGFHRGWQGFVSAFTFGQTVCHSVMQTFSGMRTDEVGTTPYACFEQVRRKWGVVYFIKGITTKGNGAGRETQEKWVTSKEAAQAIAVAQKIADHIYKVTGVGDGLKGDEKPLFVSTGYLDGTGATPNSEHGVARTHISIGNDNGTRLQDRMDLMIDENDIRELRKIEPGRPWALEERYTAGFRWKIRSRQIRRSLAMYASASGLVTLQALKAQLKHLTRDMARYYANGAKALTQFAMDDKQHFAYEYQRTQFESEFLSYTQNVLETAEVLAGGHGTFVTVNKAKNGGQISPQTLEQTKKDFKAGKNAYKETPMGGCTTITPCEKHMLGRFGDCDRCARAVVIPGKLDKTIILMECFVAKLTPGSLEHRSEMRDLAKLKEVRANL